MAIVELRNDSCSGIAGNHYHTWSLDTQVEPAIRNVIPSNAVLTSVVLVVEAYHTWTSFLGNNANISIAAWFCPEENKDNAYNSGTTLISSTRFTNNKTWATYKSDNIVGYFQTTYPFNINAPQPRLSVYFKSNNAIDRTYYHRVYFDIQYTIHEHSYTSSSSVIVNPTCNGVGTRRHYCSCGAYTDETMPATGHNYVANTVVPPSGPNYGATEYICSNGCGSSELRDFTWSISAKAGTGCSYISLDGWSVVYEGETMSHNLAQGSNFTLWSDPKEGYEFDRWNIVNADGSVSTSTEQNLPVTLNNNVSVEAIYKRITYTATFLNGDGSVLETVTVAHGDAPVCSKTPTKASTEAYSYTWDEANPWTPTISALTGNQTYTPNFITKAWFGLSFEHNEFVPAYDVEIVTGEQNGMKFTEGSVVKITAKIKQGYVFLHWEDNSTDNPRFITITDNITLGVVVEKEAPKFTEVKMLYLDKQISATNKVPADEYFILSVKVQ